MSDITSVTLYDTLGVESTDFIINQCELKTVFCTADKISQLAGSLQNESTPSLQNLVLLDNAKMEEIEVGEAAGLKIYHMENVISTGMESEISLPNPNKNSIFTICYTSGTTGDPKGVMLSHLNLISVGTGLNRIGVKINDKDVHLSYLPLAHIMERTICQVMIMRGGSIGFFGGDVMKLKDDLTELQPTIFVSVPRLFNRFYDAMNGKIKEL
jgi:long-chain acyl-CoA synthetase